jgi:hypothetical protein
MTLLFTTISYGQNVWHASALSGDDADDGKSWANAKLTLASVIDSVATDRDTVLLHGDFGTEDVTGGIGNKAVLMDSALHANQGWLWDITTPTDTTLMWTSEFSSWVPTSPTDDSTDFGGIVLDRQSEARQGWVQPGGGTNFEGIKFKYCKFTTTNVTPIPIGINVRGPWDITYCLFIPRHSTTLIFYNPTPTDQPKDVNLVHNTIACSSGNIILDIDDAVTPATNSIFRDNIIYQIGDGVTMVDHSEPDENLNDINYNVWFSDDADFPTDGGFEWDDLSPKIDFPSWRDSLQTGVKGIDPDGESNSQFTNPLLNDVASTAYIDQDSPAFNAASDKINNIGDIGYYQTGLSRTFHVRRRGLLRSQ